MYDKNKFGYVSVAVGKYADKELAYFVANSPHLYPVKRKSTTEYKGLMRMSEAKRLQRYLNKTDGYGYWATLDGLYFDHPENWKRWKNRIRF